MFEEGLDGLQLVFGFLACARCCSLILLFEFVEEVTSECPWRFTLLSMTAIAILQDPATCGSFLERGRLGLLTLLLLSEILWINSEVVSFCHVSISIFLRLWATVQLCCLLLASHDSQTMFFGTIDRSCIWLLQVHLEPAHCLHNFGELFLCHEMLH